MLDGTNEQPLLRKLQPAHIKYISATRQRRTAYRQSEDAHLKPLSRRAGLIGVHVDVAILTACVEDASAVKRHARDSLHAAARVRKRHSQLVVPNTCVGDLVPMQVPLPGCVPERTVGTQLAKWSGVNGNDRSTEHSAAGCQDGQAHLLMIRVPIDVHDFRMLHQEVICTHWTALTFSTQAGTGVRAELSSNCTLCIPVGHKSSQCCTHLDC